MFSRFIRVRRLCACAEIRSGDFAGYPQNCRDGHMSAWPERQKAHVGENYKIL